MYSLCLLHKIVSYESISICCFWCPKGIFEGPIALAAAECNIIALYCLCTCPDTLYRCPKNIVQFSEHPIEYLNESCSIELEAINIGLGSSLMQQLLNSSHSMECSLNCN
jgi:hypothetical protein